MAARAHRIGDIEHRGGDAAVLDPYAARFLKMVAVGGAGGADLASRREGLRELARLAGAGPREVTVTDLDLGDAETALPARHYDARPVDDRKNLAAGLVYFHGGGLVAGDLDTHDAVCRRLASASGCSVVAVDYRLAPENPFPAALEDATSAYLEVARQATHLGIDPMRLAIGGDSAGAGLAALACLALGKAGLRIPLQLLICPVLAVEPATASRQEFARGYFLDAANIRQDAAACGLSRTADPFAVLLDEDLSIMPPALLHTAGFDMTRDEGSDYAARLARAGVPVRHVCHATMIHYFYALGSLIPRSRDILAAIGADLAGLLGEGPGTAPTFAHGDNA